MSLSKKNYPNQKKTCKNCQIEKALADFYRNRQDYHPRCKECMRKKANERWANATKKQKESRRKYARKYFKEYRKKNREKILEYYRNYRDENREELREYWIERYYLVKQRKSSGNKTNRRNHR